MLAKIYGAAIQGVEAKLITVEVSVHSGTKYVIVGLPDNAVKESWHRIESAMKHYDYYMPRTRVVVNLAPADIRKEGASFDLPIAVGILKATDQIIGELDGCLIMGEISLDGSVQPMRGVLPMAIEAARQGFKKFIVPEANAKEAAIVEQLEVYGVKSLREVRQFLNNETEISPTQVNIADLFDKECKRSGIDFEDVKGQHKIKRAMEIAAAGAHNLILIGPPGAGKTMLAKRFPGILPPLTLEEAMETTKVHSISGLLGSSDSLMLERPFRSPHHTVSDVALVGGGSNPMPGEISLAHNGVLFLDELPEFKRSALEVLRQPLEDRQVTISRSRVTLTYPSSFTLITSMNPCPCGYYNHPEKECVCGPGIVQRYLNKISGPLMDRIDLHVEVTPVPFRSLSQQTVEEKSESVRLRVMKARKIQSARYYDSDIHANAQMSARQLRTVCNINEASRKLLNTAMEKLSLSARAYDRILKVSRTIADLDGAENIETNHLAEAIQFRSLDRESWGN